MRRASRIASAAARRSPETSVRSDASIATSVPVPIASPRSACASAGASLTPSPTIATTSPVALQPPHLGDLVLGIDLGEHALDPDLGRDPLGGLARVAGEQHRRQPERAQLATASALVGLTVSATTSRARSSPSQLIAFAVDHDSRPSTVPTTPRPGHVAELRHGRQLADLGPRGRGDRLRDRVLAGALDGAREPQDLRRDAPLSERDVRELQPPLGHRAGLVEHDRRDAPRLLEDLRAP